MSLVLSRDHLFPRDGRIMRWGRVRALWREVLLNGLLDGVIAWEVAELSLWSGELEYDEKKRRKECVRTLEGSFISKLRRCRVLQLRCRKVGIRLSSTLVRDSEQFRQWAVKEAYP